MMLHTHQCKASIFLMPTVRLIWLTLVTRGHGRGPALLVPTVIFSPFFHVFVQSSQEAEEAAKEPLNVGGHTLFWLCLYLFSP